MNKLVESQVNSYKRRINEMLKRVPASINNGSYQTAVEYKKLAATASKSANSARAKIAVLQNLHNQLSAYQ